MCFVLGLFRALQNTGGALSYKARGENWYTKGNFGQELLGRIVRAFSSNSLVNTMEMTADIQYILTAAQSLGSQDHYKKS